MIPKSDTDLLMSNPDVSVYKEMALIDWLDNARHDLNLHYSNVELFWEIAYAYRKNYPFGTRVLYFRIPKEIIKNSRIFDRFKLIEEDLIYEIKCGEYYLAEYAIDYINRSGRLSK